MSLHVRLVDCIACALVLCMGNLGNDGYIVNLHEFYSVLALCLRRAYPMRPNLLSQDP
jgi:hypothetical protein